MPDIMGLYFVSVEQSVLIVGDIIYSIAIKIGCILVAFGILDFIYQWWSFEKKMMMSKQEVKDEFKQTEGDPQIKGKVRDLQRKAALRRMMKRVPEADVVVRNPTHYAVALAYNPQKNKAPVIVAKGVDYLALRIVEIAEEHGVVTTENPPLARGLYQAVEVEAEIPPEFYQAVAQVLSFVYNLRKRNGAL
jgi:flagellar biosynthetic protein FlhB